MGRNIAITSARSKAERREAESPFSGIRESAVKRDPAAEERVRFPASQTIEYKTADDAQSALDLILEDPQMDWAPSGMVEWKGAEFGEKVAVRLDRATITLIGSSSHVTNPDGMLTLPASRKFIGIHANLVALN